MNTVTGQPLDSLRSGDQDVDVSVVPADVDRKIGRRVIARASDRGESDIKFGSKLFHRHHRHAQSKEDTYDRHAADRS